jgi:pimeloyl-ACP methyl ester carboxylesterase
MRLHHQKQNSGFPLILLHGFLGSSDNWRAMSRRLAEHSCVYSVDLRNHGQSPHSAVMNHPAMAADLCEFLDAEGITAAHLLGHSMGGKVAMRFATEYPDRVEKLIVVDIAARAYAPTHGPMLSALAWLDLKALRSFGDAEAALVPTISDSALRLFLVKNLVRRDDGSFGWKIGLGEIMANYEELTEAVPLETPFTRATCFIRGGRSCYIRDDDIAALRSHFPKSEFHTVERAGHWIHTDAPDEFFATVTDFLTGMTRL